MAAIHPFTPKPDPTLEQYDNHRLYERCVVDQIAEIVSQHLYTKSYDRLPAPARVLVEGAALRAVRVAQAPWRAEAHRRATVALEHALAVDMGAAFAALSPADRTARARNGVRAVLGALVGVLEVGDPFEGPGDAMRIYHAAEQEAKELR